VDEACSNVIDHAYGGEDRGEIRILLDLNDKGLKITIQDDGTPFEPEDVAEPDLISPLETRCERGLGVFLIRKIMDEARWDFSIPGVNQLTLVKYFTANQNPQTHD